MMCLIQLPPLYIKGKKPGVWLRKSRPLLPEDFVGISADSLAAMRLAHSRPMQLNAGQEAGFNAMRRTAAIAVYKTERKLRGTAGKLVYRRAGKGGADLPVSPVEWDLAQARAAFRTKLYEAFKQPPPSEAGVTARQATAQTRAELVLALWPTYAGRGRNCVNLIAKKIGEPIHYVQRILREARTRPAALIS